MAKITKATKAKNAKLLQKGDMKAIMKALLKAGIRMEEGEYSWSKQDTYTHETINGPNTYRGYPYSPMSFSRIGDQLDQAENIMKSEGMI